MPAARWIILGNAENRRVTLFQEALVAQGRAPAAVVPWTEFLQDPAALGRFDDVPSVLRIESFGESFEVEKLLLLRGAAEAPRQARLNPQRVRRLMERRGEILAPRQAHLGFLAALRDVEQIISERPHWRVLSPPNAIADLFDKRITSRMYERIGVPVPPRIEGIESLEQLRAAVAERDWESVFVKLSSGSSASCLGIYRPGTSGDEFLTTVEMARDGWFNNLNLQRITSPPRIEEVMGYLLEEGVQIERALPKARLAGENFDCRVVVISGEPAFTVVRQSSHPITNLHLGGRRGDLEAFTRAVPTDLYEAAMESCRRIARAHGCLAVGVDLMYSEGFEGHFVLEGNAFGDLLPNLQRDGLSVYEWEIREVVDGRPRPPPDQPLLS